MLDGGSQVLREVAMALFDSRGGLLVKLSYEDIAGIECLRIIVMATNFGSKIAITGFA